MATSLPTNSQQASPSKSRAGAVGGSAASLDSEQHKHIEKHLQSLLSALQKQEPLDNNYESLLPVSFRKHAKASASINKSADKQQTSSTKSDVFTADVKLHRRLKANLRSTVETYASTPAGWRRRPNTRRLDIDFGSSSQSNAKGGDGNNDEAARKTDEIEAKLRAAFALRESKEHEQRDLVSATLKAENAELRSGWGFSQVGAAPMAGMQPPKEEASIRKKRLDGIAKQLREKEKGAADRAKWTNIARRGKGLVSHIFATIVCEKNC